MEIWFFAAICGAIASGVSNFFFKVAAIRNCNAELFILYSSLTSIVTMTFVILLWPQPVLGFGWTVGIVFFSGIISAVAGSMKVYALRYIDSTIYFPLFKLLAPALAIVAGVSYFQETFSPLEWTGLVAGLLVPMMLINPTENGRQNNLIAGLLIVLVTGVLSAATAVIAKYAIELNVPVNTLSLIHI